jgi:hypothetical protein
MTVHRDHTIVPVHDKRESANFLEVLTRPDERGVAA